MEIKIVKPFLLRILVTPSCGIKINQINGMAHDTVKKVSVAIFFQKTDYKTIKDHSEFNIMSECCLLRNEYYFLSLWQHDK